MNAPSIDEVMRVLRNRPDGVTTREVVAEIGAVDIKCVSARLSRLAAYGKIEREVQRFQPGERDRTAPTKWYVWKLKVREAAHA